MDHQAAVNPESPEVDTEDMDQDLIPRVARDMVDTALDLILSRQREATEVTVVDQVQGSLVKDLVDMVMAVDQVQGSQEKHLDTVVMDREAIQRVQREATEDTALEVIRRAVRDHLEDTDQARAVANLVRDLVVTVTAVDQVLVNLASQEDTVLERVVRFMYLFIDLFHTIITSYVHHLTNTIILFSINLGKGHGGYGRCVRCCFVCTVVRFLT